MKLHIAGAFELLIDDVVHAAAGIDEAGGDDSQAAALLRIPGCPEESFGRIKSDGIDATREGAAAGRHGEVVRPGEPGEAIKQDQDVLSAFDQPLGTIES